MGALLTVCLHVSAQKVTIETVVNYPDNEKAVVVSDNTIHSLEGSNVTYKFAVEGLATVESVVSCQYTYNGGAPVDAVYGLANGVLTINNVLFDNLAVNTEPNKFSINVTVKEKGKDKNTVIPVAEAMGVRIYAKPSCSITKEPVRFIYMEKTAEAQDWEATSQGGGNWQYTWKSTAGHQGTSNAFSIAELSTLGETTVSLSADNLAPDNKTVWAHYDYSWKYTIYGKADIQGLNTNTETNPLELFQNQNWPLEAKSVAGFPDGWTYEWKDVDSGTDLGHNAAFVFTNPETDDIVNRHVELTVKNMAVIGQNQTEEWFNQSYHFYVKFFPQPVVTFDDEYAKNVLDGETQAMSFSVNDHSGNTIINDPNYTWTYKWTDGSKSGNETTYNFVADNASNDNGKQSPVTVVVSGLLKNGNGKAWEKTIQHTYMVWPIPGNTVGVPVNGQETPIEYFQNQKCQLSTTPNGGYKPGWTYEWKDVESGEVLSQNPSFALESKLSDDIVKRHVELTIVNTAVIKDNETKEWFRASYNYYVNYHPAPVVAFENTYPVNVIDGDKVPMGFTIKDRKGNSIIDNSSFVWSFEWKENNALKSQSASYDYIASNAANNNGEQCQLTLTVLGRLNGVNATFTTDCPHTYVIWPKPEVRDLSNSKDVKVECGGRTLDVQVVSSGGQNTGWTCQWLKDGKEISGETAYRYVKTLERTSKSDTITEKYSVHVRNITENVVRKDTTITYTVLLYPEPWVPTDIAIVDKNRNVTPQNAIREGNTVSLLCAECYGGYPGAWTYVWTQNGKAVSGDHNSETTITGGYSGESKDNSKTVELKCVVYNGYNSIPWESDTYTKTYTVYKKPQTPLSIVKKGSGKSGTVIATTKLSDADLQNCDYYLVFGYIDANGTMHDFASQQQMNPGEVRWSKQLSSEAVNNSSNTLYVYALWKYASAEVTSGLRTVNSVDEEWDGSDYTGVTRSVIGQATAIEEQSVNQYPTSINEVYSIDGRKQSQMTRGMNVVKNSDGSVKKVMLK